MAINSKRTVIIGDQEWMLDLLNVEKFNNGDQIHYSNNLEEWINQCRHEKPTWCFYSDDLKQHKLYNYYAINDCRGIAPLGYRAPSQDDFEKACEGDLYEIYINAFSNLPKGIRRVGTDMQSGTKYFDFYSEDMTPLATTTLWDGNGEDDTLDVVIWCSNEGYCGVGNGYWGYPVICLKDFDCESTDDLFESKENKTINDNFDDFE